MEKVQKFHDDEEVRFERRDSVCKTCAKAEKDMTGLAWTKSSCKAYPNGTKPNDIVFRHGNCKFYVKDKN